MKLKKTLMTLVCMSLVSSVFAKGPSLKQQLKTVKSCDQGYDLTIKRLRKTYDADGELTSAVGLLALLGASVTATPAVVLIIPAAFTYNGIRELQDINLARAQNVFIASQDCQKGDCDQYPLEKLNKWLSKKGVSVTNQEIAEIVNDGAVDFNLCTKKVKDNGVRVMKGYHELKHDILKKLSGKDKA